MKDLSSLTLARLIMARLEDAYSAGGISMHRARRASFLEYAMYLIPLENHLWDVDLNVFMDEAKGRALPTDPIFIRELITDITLFSDEQYIVLSLIELGKWYAQDPLVPIDSETFVSIAEKRIYDSFSRLLRVEQGAAELEALGISFTSKEILKEGYRREGLRKVQGRPLADLI